MESSTAMMAITTNSSMSVKPLRIRVFVAIIDVLTDRAIVNPPSPIAIRLAVDAVALRAREHVEHIVALARIVWRAGVAALAPAGGYGHRGVGIEGIARNAAQKVK